MFNNGDVDVDDFDEIDFQLYFFNKECDECPMHSFDFDTEEWELTKLKPKPGDHVVKDGTEMVYSGRGKYHDLGPDEGVWDYSEPEAAKIEVVDYSEDNFSESSKLDPFVDPDTSIHLLNHF